jgi:signal transduction histidine kinase
MVLLVATLTFTILNRTFSKDAYFAPVAFFIIFGYSTVGAVLASRTRRNAIGSLMIVIGFAFALVGFTSEYIVYAYETNPGSLPLRPVAAVISNTLWLPMFTAVILLVLLYPSGQVPGPRWRFLPKAIIGLSALALVAGILYPGPLDLDLAVRIENPIGVDRLEPVINVAAGIGWIGLLVTAPLSIVALVLRYRRSKGEERQQLRWLAYIAGTTAVVAVSGIVTATVMGDSFGGSPLATIFGIAGFGLVGICLPIGMGVAVLRYRLYDLDLVVKKTVLYVTVAALLSASFVAIAVLIGWLAGRTETGALVAAVAVGLAFWPAVRLARRLADRIVYGTRATPYEVLAEFSDRVGASYGSEDVLPRMAQILRDAVGAAEAIVWLRVGGELRPAGVVPAEDTHPVHLSGDELPVLLGDAVAEVRDRGELLGALAVSMPPNDPMTPSRERLVRDLAAQAGLVLRNVRLIEELRASRQRLVAAQDEERRKLERNLHDGAQQQLVALSVKLRLAEQLADRDPSKTKEALAALQTDTQDALENLRDLARGIYPPLLADQGLPAALEAQARRASVPVEINPGGVGRYPRDVESAVYFCTLEALNNVAKYADASSVHVRLAQTDEDLVFEIVDDGRGFDPASTGYGTGLQGMADRLDAIGGSLEVRSALGSGTSVTGRVPILRDAAR